MTDRCFSCDRRLSEMMEVACSRCMGEARNRPKAGHYPHEDIVKACRNIGFDLECGSCASLFFTGYGGYEHCESCATVKGEQAPVVFRAELACGCVEEDGEFIAWCIGEDCRKSPLDLLAERETDWPDVEFTTEELATLFGGEG